MVGKQLELAQQMKPAAKVGIIFNGASVDASTDRREAEVAGAALNMTCLFADVRTRDQLDAVFHRLAHEGVDAVVVLYNSLFYQERRRIAVLSAARRLPGIYAARDHVVEGGLMSYGISLRASARRMTTYVDKIFKGAQPVGIAA